MNNNRSTIKKMFFRIVGINHWVRDDKERSRFITTSVGKIVALRIDYSYEPDKRAIWCVSCDEEIGHVNHECESREAMYEILKRGDLLTATIVSAVDDNTLEAEIMMDESEVKRYSDSRISKYVDWKKPWSVELSLFSGASIYKAREASYSLLRLFEDENCSLEVCREGIIHYFAYFNFGRSAEFVSENARLSQLAENMSDGRISDMWQLRNDIAQKRDHKQKVCTKSLEKTLKEFRNNERIRASISNCGSLSASEVKSALDKFPGDIFQNYGKKSFAQSIYYAKIPVEPLMNFIFGICLYEHTTAKASKTDKPVKKKGRKKKAPLSDYPLYAFMTGTKSQKRAKKLLIDDFMEGAIGKMSAINIYALYKEHVIDSHRYLEVNKCYNIGNRKTYEAWINKI